MAKRIKKQNIGRLRGVEKAQAMMKGMQRGGKVEKRVGNILNEARLSARKAALGFLNIDPSKVKPGLGGPGDPRALAQHETTSRLLTEKLAKVLPSELAGSLVRGAGNLNEVLSGAVNVIGGDQFFSQQGFDIEDLRANEKGIRTAIEAETPPIELGSFVRGQTGGRVVPARGPEIRVPTMELLRRFQAGGNVSAVIPGLFEDFGGAQQAQTGAQRRVAGQLEQFDPFQGQVGQAAQGTLTGLLQTGSPTDISPILDVAQQRAGRTFQQAAGGINEQLGALGLGSSTARTRALGEAAADVATRVGETGTLAGVQAQESATQRQLAALSPAAQSAQQRLGGLGAAAGQFGQAAGTEAQTQLGALGGASNLAQGLLPSLGGALGGGGGGGFGAPTGQQTRATPLGGNRSLVARSFQVGGPIVTPFGNPSVVQNQRVDQGDFLSNLLFGRQFERRAPDDRRRGRDTRDRRGSGPTIQEIQALERLRRQESRGGPGRGFTSSRVPLKIEANPFAPGGIGISGRIVQPNIFSFDPRTGQSSLVGAPERGGFAEGAGDAGIRSTGQLEREAELQARIAASARSGEVTGFEGGGKIEGPAVPPDTVPILAQGGEGVLNVQLMSRVKKSKSKDPLMRDIKKLMFSKEKGPGDKAQEGGAVQSIPTDIGNQFIQRLREQFGETPQFTDADLGAPIEGAPGGGLSVLGAEPISEEDQIVENANAARRRADLVRQAAQNSPLGARIQGQVAEAEAAAQEAEAQVAGLAEAAVPRQQVFTTKRTAEETQQAQLQEQREELERQRKRGQQIIDKARDKDTGALNVQQIVEALGIEGINPELFPGLGQAQQAQEQALAAQTVTGALQQAAQSEEAAAVEQNLNQPQVRNLEQGVPTLQAFEGSIQQGQALSDEQVQQAVILLRQFKDEQQSLGVDNETIIARMNQFFSGILSDERLSRAFGR